MRRLVLTFACFLWMSGLALAAGTCGTGGKTGTSPYTVTANTPAHVSACISVVESGSTIQLLSGTTDWTGSTVSVSKSVTILGAGNTGCPTSCNDATVILTGGGQPFTTVVSNWRISGITFDGGCATYGCIYINKQGTGHSGTRDWRVDHNHFKNTTSGRAMTIGSGATSGGYGYVRDYPGLIDSNRFDAYQKFKVAEINGHQETIAGPWDDPFSLSDGDYVFLEDNYFVHDYAVDGVSTIDTIFGGKAVVRFNYFRHADVYSHGTEMCFSWSLGPPPSYCYAYATRGLQVYHNTFEWPNTSPTRNFIMNVRGGTGVFFNNTLTGSVGNYAPFRWLYERGDLGRSCNQVGACNGNTSVDGNESGKRGYRCYQQIGSGGPTGIAEEPSYMWGNTWNGSTSQAGMSTITTDITNCIYAHVQFGRDVILMESTKVGPTLPSTCTRLDGFWKTNEGYWNTKNDSPTVTADGVLYKCTATNTWTPHFTPYPYPHPARSGLAAPTGVTVK